MKTFETIHQKVRFGNHRNTFLSSLKEKAHRYFEDENIASTGNAALYIKALFFLSSYVFCYVFIVFALPDPLIAIMGCAYMGAAAAGLGFNIMHDGAHGSFSHKKWINTLAAYSINMLGGDAVLWKNKHNVIHHTYTNLEGHDQDIAQLPVLRTNNHQKKYIFHKYQHIYCFLVYGLSSLLWVFLLDFIKYFSGKVGNFKLSQMTIKDHIIFWVSKVFYFSFALIIPSLIWGFAAAMTGFLIYHFVLGLILSTVFQLAHVVEDTEFTDTHLPSQKISDEWAIHQLKTTANFGTTNSFLTWYVGGLNFQVAHHLFPKVSHIHYPALNKIIKETCAQQQIIYHEFSSFGRAVQSHRRHLKHTAVA